MANRRASFPLNETATETANKKLYAKYPELKGRRLSPTSTADAKYREFWMDSYLDALPKPPPAADPAPPLQLVLNCTETKKPGCGRSADSYKEQALRNIGANGSSGQELNPAITKAYADLYKSDPATFKWAGMAAFASCEVGKGIKEAKKAQSGWRWAGGWVAGVDGEDLEKALKAGNLAVYQDIAWQHLAYQACGLAEIQKAYDDGQITDDVLQAWRKIDEGKGPDCSLLMNDGSRLSVGSTTDPKLIWEGNKMLLEYEQRDVLQKQVYDKDPKMWRNASTPPASTYQSIDSPIPGDYMDFQRYTLHNAEPESSIGDFDSRWDWIENSMLPNWQKLDATGVDNVSKEMAPCVGGTN